MRESSVGCSHRPACPGCPRFGERGLAPSALSRLAALAARAGLPKPRVVAGAPYGFRHRARLAIRGRSANPKLGIFQLGTHRVVHIPDCRIHHPLINGVARVVRRALVEHGVPPYSDVAHAGRARALQVVIERGTERAQVVLITNDTAPDGLEPVFAAIRDGLGAQLHSLFWNGNPERTNTVLGGLWRQISGPDAVVEVVGGVRLHYPPGAFGQSNLPLAERLAARVAELVPDDRRVLELYAGTGALGLPLAARSRALAVNEIGEHSLAGLALGIAELPPEVRARIRVHPGAADAAAAFVAESDVVVADPPRKGLDRGVIEALLAAPPERFVYVSCGLDSFLVQADELLGDGRFALSLLEAFALFPFTEHVETVALFEARRA